MIATQTRQRKREEASDLLQPGYDRCNEGFDRQDLMDAEAPSEATP